MDQGGYPHPPKPGAANRWVTQQRACVLGKRGPVSLFVGDELEAHHS